MELWVRTQNKGALLKVELIGNTDGVLKSYVGDTATVLGEYSNERALEVLDEIQQIINGEITIQKSVKSQIVDYGKIIELNVYEMPKE